MADINKKIISNAIKKYLRSEKLAFVLGNSNETINRSLNNQEDIITSSSVAFTINPKQITEAIRVPKEVQPAIWKIGLTKKVGTFSSNIPGKPDENNWSLFYGTGQYGNYVFLILSISENNDLQYESDPVVIVENLIDISGNIAKTSDGKILYCAVHKTEDNWITNYKTHYIPYYNVKDNIKEKEEYYTSNASNATRICGAGNEQRCGTCCLYYSEGGYDPIAGLTFSAGGFYKCIESKCYQCSEIAQSLGMRHIFNNWRGGTGVTGGTGGRCSVCDSVNFPSECGPCPCSISWSDDSYYKNIIKDPNISSELSEWKNANYENIGREKYGNGSISRVSINLSGVSLNDKKLSSGWKNRDLYVPFSADFSSSGREPLIRVLTYKDSKGNQYINGIAHAVDHGDKLRNIKINTAVWEDMFPNVPANRLSIELIPSGGFPANLDSIFGMGTLLSVDIKNSDIENTGTIQTVFNMVSIQAFKDENDINALSGLGPSQIHNFITCIVIEAHKKEYLGLSMETLPDKDSLMLSQTNPYAGGAGDSQTNKTTINSVRVLASKNKPGSSTIVVMEIASNSPENFIVGNEFNIDDITWVIDSVSIPTSYSGDKINKAKTNILHLDKTNINISKANDPNYVSSWSFRFFLGG
mgnify:CR=1 FL=1